MTSSVHTASNYPSSLLVISSASPYAPLWPEIDADERLQAMEEEQTANQMKTDANELALKAIMNKLEVPVPEESVMDEEFNFGRNSGIPVDSKMHAPGHVKIKLAMPSDFDGDCKKGWAFLNSCNIYFAICGDLFPNEQAQIHWALSFFKANRATHFSNKVLWTEVKVKCMIYNIS